MATHSSTLSWKIPWMEERGRQQSMGSQRVGHDRATSLSRPHLICPLPPPQPSTFNSSSHQISGSQPGAVLPPRGHMATPGDSCACHKGGGGVCRRHEWAETSVAVEQHTEEPPQQRTQSQMSPVLRPRNPDLDCVLYFYF